jgi:hypothetical protein
MKMHVLLLGVHDVSFGGGVVCLKNVSFKWNGKKNSADVSDLNYYHAIHPSSNDQSK